jgi:hypothetical protein
MQIIYANKDFKNQTHPLFSILILEPNLNYVKFIKNF